MLPEGPRLASMFTSHMVLQQRVRVPVWGWAAPGQPVTVRFAGQVRTGTADAAGCWRVTLDPLKPGVPFEMTVTGRGTVRLDDIAVGEVWLASGQSNMEWPVSRADRAVAEMAAADRPGIRLFSVKRTKADEPCRTVTGAWQPCSPERVAAFSAVAYFFARQLHDVLGVPIGIINASWDGSRAEAWTPRQTLLADPALKGIVERAECELAEYERRPGYYDELQAQWLLDVRHAEASGRPRPCKLDLPIKPRSRGASQNNWMVRFHRISYGFVSTKAAPGSAKGEDLETYHSTRQHCPNQQISAPQSRGWRAAPGAVLRAIRSTSHACICSISRSHERVLRSGYLV